MGVWTGLASTIGNCQSFNNENLPVRSSDATYVATSACPLNEGVTETQAYGFSWNDAADGKVYYKGIFYVPDDSYTIVNACSNEQVISTPVTASNSEPINLDYMSDRRILSLNNVMELVKDKAVCVSESSNELSFWWNENYLYDKLAQQYDPYFEDIRNSDPDFMTCN